MPNDKCVICGCDSGFSKDTPIENRESYVPGSGQLCRKCYCELYLKTGSKDSMSFLLKLLLMSRDD